MLSLWMSSCNSSKQPPHFTDTPTSGEINISVDETFKPIIEEEAKNFEHLYAEAKINASYKPEAEAVKDLIDSEARLIIIPRLLSASEMTYFQQKQLQPKITRIGLDAVAFIVNPQNPDSNISYQQALSIISGETDDWKKLDPSSKLGKITLIFDNNNSSTISYLKDSVLKGGTLSAGSYAVNSSDSVVNYVAGNPSSIGVIGVSWISEKDDSITKSFLSKVRAVGITSPNDSTNSTEYYQPYQYYIMQHQYPFCRNLYIISREFRAGLGTGFASYIASDDGQRIILRWGLVPATQPVRVVRLRNSF